MSNLYKINYLGLDSVRSNSPIYCKSQNASPMASSFQSLAPRKRPYKSQQSTPKASLTAARILSFEYASHYFSDTKEPKSKDQVDCLRQKIQIQEKRILLLEEENKRLSQMKKPDYWEKELIKRNDDIRKLENQLKYLMEHGTEGSENERLLEKDNKIEILKIEISEFKLKLEHLERKNEELSKENRKIMETYKNHSNCLKKEEYELFLIQINELEVSLEFYAGENQKLKEENEKLKLNNNSGSLIYFSQDINKIKREINKLARVLDDFTKGKEITLKGLLGIVIEYKNEPLKQITVDLQSIKTDLNQVLTMISDIHAEQCSNTFCRNQ